MRILLLTTAMITQILASTDLIDKKSEKKTKKETFSIDETEIEKLGKKTPKFGEWYLGERIKIMPKDLNENNVASGPAIFTRIDNGIVNTLRQYCGGDVATLRSEIDFIEEIKVADELSIYVKIVRTGKTSMDCLFVGICGRKNVENPIPVVKGLFTFVQYKNGKAHSLPLNKQNLGFSEKKEPEKKIELGLCYLMDTKTIDKDNLNEHKKLSKPNLFEYARHTAFEALNLLKKKTNFMIKESHITLHDDIMSAGNILELWATLYPHDNTSIKCIVEGYKKSSQNTNDDKSKENQVFSAAFIVMDYKDGKIIPLYEDKEKNIIPSKL